MRTAIPVNFTLALNGRTGPRSSQVAHALIDAIARGQVHDGDQLPSTRTMAATFGLARTAVVGAYEELTAAGFLVARPGGSTYVEHGAGAAARAGAFGAAPAAAPGAGASDAGASDAGAPGIVLPPAQPAPRRASPNVAARVRVEGSRSPSWTWPRAMASNSARASWLDRGPGRPFRSSVKLTGVAVRTTSVCGTGQPVSSGRRVRPGAGRETRPVRQAARDGHICTCVSGSARVSYFLYKGR